MKDKFELPKSQVVGMTQFYTQNFNDPSALQYISTYDVSSCVVILLKNIDSQKQCSAFGMAHFNLANVYFQQSAQQNLESFISEFEKIGGDLSTASVQLLGGLITDTNQVREKLIANLREIGKNKGIAQLTIKVPENFKIDMSLESMNRGDGQKMTIACDKSGTYIRKVIFKAGVKASQELYPADCQLLSDSNLKNIVSVERDEHLRLLSKTSAFQTEVNRLVNTDILPSSTEYKGMESKIHNRYCIMEKVVNKSARNNSSLKTNDAKTELQEGFNACQR